MKKYACIVFVLAYLLLPRPSAIEAQLAVFDAANEVHNVQKVLHLITQIQHMVTKIELMLINLESIDDVFDLTRVLNHSLKTLSRTTGIPYEEPAIVAAISNLYPLYRGKYPGIFTYNEHVNAMHLQTWRAVEDAASGQAIQPELELDRVLLSQQLLASRSAIGNLQVQQAGNELVALSATQTMRLQQIEAMNGRVLTSQILQDAAKDDMERARMEWLAEEWALAGAHPGGGVSLQ